MYHLAQINISRLLKPIDSPQLSEFVGNLDKINTLAESSKGFVWRLKDESGNATEIKGFDDPMVIVNMSVWEGVDDLKTFAYRTEHVNFIRKRNQWFEKPQAAYMAMWWIRRGEFPSVEDGKARLGHLNQHGETAFAFTFRKIFEPAVFKLPVL